MRGIGHPVTTHIQSEGSDILSRPSLAASEKRGFHSPLAAFSGGAHCAALSCSAQALGVHPWTPAPAERSMLRCKTPPSPCARAVISRVSLNFWPFIRHNSLTSQECEDRTSCDDRCKWVCESHGSVRVLTTHTHSRHDGFSFLPKMRSSARRSGGRSRATPSVLCELRLRAL